LWRERPAAGAAPTNDLEHVLTQPAQQLPALERVPRLRAGAWVLYDLANTIYSATLTFLFTPYITERFEHRTGLGVTQTVSMLLAAALVLVFGAISDRTMRARGYLAVVTLACVAAMAGWGLGGDELWLLGCFFAANVTYNLGLLFYNTLLPSVAPDDKVGLLSGIGVGVGYIGTILVIAVLVMLVPKEVPPETKLLLAALGFLLLSLPCLLLVSDRRQPAPGSAAPTIGESMRSLGKTLRSLPRHKPLLFFLLANFCLVDVVNTAILFFADFTTELFKEAAMQGNLTLFGADYVGDDGIGSFTAHMGLGLNVLALPFAIGMGLWTDKRPLLVMRSSAVALLLALGGAALFGGTSALGYLLTLVVLGAFGLAGIWTAGRKVLLRLAPRQQIGEFFSLYGTTMKLSVIGSTVFAVIADEVNLQAAILSQSLLLVVGLVLLSLVRLPPSDDADAP